MRRRQFIFFCALLCAVMAAFPAFSQEAGSWNQINQVLTRPEGWRSYVAESPFSLGLPEQVATVAGAPLYEMGYGSYPSIDGSTVAVPMAMEFARQHLPLEESDLAGFIFFSTTHGAYEHLIGQLPNGSSMIASQNAMMEEARPVDLILVTEPSEEELAMAAAAGVTLVMKPVCYDAFVFITHADNPVQSLTVEQIQKMYTGEITNWREVGGADAEIMPYQREKNSGSQTAMEKLVMQGKPMEGALENYVTEGMGSLIERIGNYENSDKSIGYTYKYYIDTLYKSDDIKVIAIDGVMPTPENMRNGSYPFTTHYYGVIRAGDEQQAGGKFLNWMLSAEGQRSIAQAGYVTIDALP